MMQSILKRWLGVVAVCGLLALSPSAVLAKCKVVKPDTSVAGIRLMDDASAVAVVGAAPQLSEGEEDLPHASFVSQNGTQMLILFVHPGSVLDEYAEVEVRETGPEALALKDLAVDSFVSGLGVELGQTPEQVIEKLGTCIKARDRDGDTEIIQYEVRDGLTNPALKAFGYDVYFAEYEFTNGKLTRYRFGFEYP